MLNFFALSNDFDKYINDYCREMIKHSIIGNNNNDVRIRRANIACIFNDKKLKWGPCVGDVSINVNGKMLPIINMNTFINDIYELNIHGIRLVVGNENISDNNCVKLVPLSQYLKNLNKYITKNCLGDICLINNMDKNVIVTTQYSVLPKYKGKNIEYNIGINNPYCSSGKPILCVVASNKGTSCQIVKSKEDILFLNKNGMNCRFTSDKNERISVFQIPLQGVMDDIKENPIHNKLLNPLCKCGHKLTKYQARYCYGDGTRKFGGIICDGCGSAINNPDELLYHCSLNKINIHEGGYDLCKECGIKQIKYNEFDDINPKYIKRDPKYPIRMSIIYIHIIDNITNINNAISYKSIKSILTNKLINKGLFYDNNSNKNINKNPEYNDIELILKKLCGIQWQKFYYNFIYNEVNMDDLPNLNDDDLRELIPKIGPRSRVKMYIKSKYKGKPNKSILNGLIHQP